MFPIGLNNLIFVINIFVQRNISVLIIGVPFMLLSQGSILEPTLFDYIYCDIVFKVSVNSVE